MKLLLSLFSLIICPFVFSQILTVNTGSSVSISSGSSITLDGLVPVLINALKEQEEKIKSQENKLLKLESLVQDLVDNQ